MLGRCGSQPGPAILSPVHPRVSVAAEPVLVAEGLRVRLGGAPILRGVDLEVRRGDLYGLLGRNGAGKTTAMRCLLGLLPQAQGRCSVFGTPARRLAEVGPPLGVALDPPGLDESLSVRENLEIARLRGGLRGGRGSDEALELVGLAARARQRADRLSHGQTRRAAVARALLGAPELLVLDEPLSGLDPEGVESLIALFRRLAQEGVTVVLSSHHLREMEDVCTRVGILEEGVTVLQGATSELLARGGGWLRLHCRAPQQAVELLRAWPGAGPAEILGDGWLRLRLDGAAPLEPLLRRLVAAELGVDEFHRERVSLVDLFREAVTGRAQERAA